MKFKSSTKGIFCDIQSSEENRQTKKICARYPQVLPPKEMEWVYTSTLTKHRSKKKKKNLLLQLYRVF